MNSKKSILITGASTGIGKTCALHLDELGFKVYAGVRKQADADNLKNEASGNLEAVILDVTNSQSIKDTANYIWEETGGNLYGLVNNAGIGRGGALEVTPMEEIRKLMDVNLFGLLEVTQSFIPMLRKSMGRIINIGSTSSYLAVPGAAAYSASKFAVKAVTDSLRLELIPFGIKVILVSPGAVESAIWEKGTKYKEEMRKSVNPEIADLYAPLRKFGDRLNEKVKKIPAMEVAKVVHDAFNNQKPKPYYIVGSDAKGAAKAAKLPKRILDWILLKRIEKLGK
ncbi:MAG: SDR family oxidoreductase [Calditrichaeota bacterium]|nr:MAG: SDR family NAD(P)-dependent oxidoreductase [Calditrichota bacterium]MBL1207673.1 SDR family oxidoreductase [Calditrichota bacterium]NOG47506.1 SDR family oxidoreductase [Calditrichota bacterium]